MNGLTRIFFRIAAVALDLCARIFVWPGEQLQGAATWCHERSKKPVDEAQL